MLIKCLFIALSGFFLSLFFIFLFKKLAVRYKVLMPQGIPLIGGIAIGLSFVLVSISVPFIYRSFPQEAIGIIIASSIMLILGMVDDWHELSVSAKFLAQLIASSILIFFGVRTQIVYIGNFFNIIITLIWIIGIMNAFNHLDVLDGLAGACALIVNLSFFTIALLNGDSKTAVLTLALMGSIIGFLIYNFPPAKVYMGNSGSHFLGFILGALAIIISYAPLERKIALVSPLFILGFPIFDTAFLIWIRLLKKRLPFKKSSDHLALLFLALGYSKKKALLIMLSLCLFFSLCGVLISKASNFFAIIIIVFVVLVSLTVTFKMNRVTADG